MPSSTKSKDCKETITKDDFLKSEAHNKDTQKFLSISQNRKRIEQGTVPKDLFVGNLQLLATMRDSAHLKCQTEGESRNWDAVIEAAMNALHFADLIILLHESQINDESCNSEVEGRNKFIKASATGYLGYSLMKQEKFALAIPNLEKSKELFGQMQRKIKHRQEDIVRNSIQYCLKEIALTGNVSLPPLLKFPRTTHLIDMGASTLDDIIGDKFDVQSICNGITSVIVEEKVDGANLGVSMCPRTGRLIAQNRSHYISSNEHAQFSRLAEWLSEHEAGLKEILQPGMYWSDGQHHYSGELILYGEWMAARHSIPYHNLPGQFIAFDLFDKKRQKFMSRSRFHSLLQKAGIPVAPTIEVRTFEPHYTKAAKKQFHSDIVRLLESKSAFRSDGGAVEGVVLRVDTCDDCWLEDRFKIVRGDFVAGCQDGHWSKRAIEKQRVDFEFSTHYLQSCFPFSQRNGQTADIIQDTTPNKNQKSKETEQKNQAASRQRRRVPRCVMLMGLPSSGKSTFASHLKSTDDNWIHVNQDIMGKKEAVQQACKASRKTRVVVDRCHPTVKERQEWLDVLHSPSKADVALVYFAASEQECCERVQNRWNHPTIPAGKGVGIVKRVAAMMEPPTALEKEIVYKSVDIVETFEDAQRLLAKWGYA